MAQKKLPIILDQKEVSQLLEQPSKVSKIGLRNLAIMKMMLNSGLRTSEVIELKRININLKTGKFSVIQGKGGKDRNLAIPKKILPCLIEWDRVGPQRDLYFSTLAGRKISRKYLFQMIKNYSKSAGIIKNISPHTLRHVFATEFYKQTKDIETLRKILGHASITTTTIYIQLANIEVEKSMENFPGF